MVSFVRVGHGSHPLFVVVILSVDAAAFVDTDVVNSSVHVGTPFGIVSADVHSF